MAFAKCDFAQNVGIGTITPNASARLDISAGNKGLLIPRVALLSASDVFTVPFPVVSLLIYNTATAGVNTLAVSPGYYYWNGAKWVSFIVNDNSLKAGWLLGGNGGTSISNNYIGTIDNQPLAFKITGTTAGYLGLDGNSYWGYKSGNLASTGFSNVAIGNAALTQLGSYSNLVAIGDSALYYNTANGNTAVGSKTLFNNTTGVFNTSMGYNALFSANIGDYNTANGAYALYYNTTGEKNTAFGHLALAFNSTGNNNTAVGESALQSNFTGSNNTAIGNFANVSYPDLVYATAIGAGATVDNSYDMAFGNFGTHAWSFGRPSATVGYALQVGITSLNGNGASLTIGGVWTNASDSTKKEAITTLDGTDILAKLKQLPITRWKYKGTNEYHIGPMAQDFHALFNVGVDNTSISSIDPAGIALKAIQAQQEEIDLLKQQIILMKIEIEKLKNK
jgi:Chaperone of endosialidase